MKICPYIKFILRLTHWILKWKHWVQYHSKDGTSVGVKNKVVHLKQNEHLTRLNQYLIYGVLKDIR